MKKTLTAIFAIYFIVRLALYYTAYIGSSDPALAASVAKYFIADDVANGFEYLRWGYVFKVLSFLFTCAYFASCLFGRILGKSVSRLDPFLSGSPYLFSAALYCEFYLGWLCARLPFSFVIGHAGETLFGFSNLSAAGWLIFYLKINALEMILTATVFALVRLVFATFPRKWHLALPAGAFIFSLITTLMFQMAVLPMFYKTTEIADGGFAGTLKKIAADRGVAVEKIEQVDESTYSNHTNAFFTGFGPWKRIFLCDTLFKSHTKGEIALIYAHELGHFVYSHEFKGILIFSAALLAFGLILKSIYFGNDPARHEMFMKRYASLTPVLFILYVMLYLFVAPAENAISRYFERNADSFAFDAVRTGVATKDDSVGLYLNLARKNRSNLLPHEANYFFFASHPRTIDRILASQEK